MHTMHNHVQTRFFDLITAKEPLYASQNNPIQTYKEMIHYRFKEVLLSAFPRFMERLDEDLINELIVQFIQSEPQTPYIWQMPNEFRHFLSQTELSKSYPFMDDLLWFEWIEIELMMFPYAKKEAFNFSWEDSLTLSDSAVIQAIDYPVFNDEGIDTAGKYAVMVYYNFDEHEVHFQQITPFMQQFIKLLDQHKARVALEIIALEYEVNKEEVQELLEAPLTNFINVLAITKQKGNPWIH